jgi:hypothetical protein
MKAPSWLVSCSLWVLALVVTAASAVYQKVTGPSYPVKRVVRVGEQQVAFRLPRSHGGAGDAQIRLAVSDPAVAGTVRFRRFPSHDGWREEALERASDALVTYIPHQPPAGKVMYQIFLTRAEGDPVALTTEPVIMRFRGALPAWVLVGHVVFIFAGMFLSTRTGLEALRPERSLRGLPWLTLLCLVIGGFTFGPIVQKYAFGAFWTGWPFGHDLTDNKIVVAVLFWAIACWRSARKRTSRRWVLAAAAVTLIVWLIPHSVLGSELDYTQTPQ